MKNGAEALKIRLINITKRIKKLKSEHSDLSDKLVSECSHDEVLTTKYDRDDISPVNAYICTTCGLYYNDNMTLFDKKIIGYININKILATTARDISNMEFKIREREILENINYHHS